MMGKPEGREPTLAVVVPAFRVAGRILDLIAKIGPEVTYIVVVDDACPEKSGDKVRAQCRDPRVRVLFQAVNSGVGGATQAGYREALRLGADIVLKLDGDGQMDPSLIPQFVAPLVAGLADYTKGNRFYRLESLATMPALRVAGNAALSLMAKVSTGYYPLFDPTNGYTAIHANVLRVLPLDKIAKRYFFETDLLFRLSTVRAVVQDIPMDARYGDETSSLSVWWAIPEFFLHHLINSLKRLFYGYFLRDFNPASVQFLIGIALASFGLVFGAVKWRESYLTGQVATSGTVMLGALPLFLGMQMLLSFLNYDFQNVPRQPIHPIVGRRSPLAAQTEEKERTLLAPEFT